MYRDFQQTGTDVIVILGDTPERARKYANITKAPFPVLSDPERAVYHSFDLDKAYILIQRTASVIVDRQGVIQYLKRATNPQLWREESRELLQAVKGLANERGIDGAAPLS
jgi:peroxiredoxin